LDLAELLARESIRPTIARYNNAGDRGRLDDLVRCFAPDGVMQIDGEGDIKGREAIKARLSRVVGESEARSGTPLVRHYTTNTHIEFESRESARVFSYFFVITEIGPDHWGRYADRLRPVGDEWLFAQRRVTTEGASEGSVMAQRHRKR
jgi:hypothetical protein